MLSKSFKEDHKIDGIFGETRSYGFHSGVDWNGIGGGNTDCGYKLYPIRQGEIVFTSYANTGYGNIVVYKIKGVFGERWIRYAHCREILVRSGLVGLDTVIATLGTTGNSTACHLHWDCIKKPFTNWRTYAKTQELLNEYFEDPTSFFNKYKDEEDNEDMPKWFTTLLNERELTIDDKSKICEIFGKAKDYDSKIKEFTEQVKSANEMLSSKSLEVSNLTTKCEKLDSKIFELEAQYNKERDKYNKESWEKEKLKISLKRLEEEIVTLNKRIETLESKNSLMSYSWITRFKSLF